MGRIKRPPQKAQTNHLLSVEQIEPVVSSDTFFGEVPRVKRRQLKARLLSTRSTFGCSTNSSDTSLDKKSTPYASESFNGNKTDDKSCQSGAIASVPVDKKDAHLQKKVLSLQRPAKSAWAGFHEGDYRGKSSIGITLILFGNTWLTSMSQGEEIVAAAIKGGKNTYEVQSLYLHEQSKVFSGTFEVYSHQWLSPDDNSVACTNRDDPAHISVQANLAQLRPSVSSTNFHVIDALFKAGILSAELELQSSPKFIKVHTSESDLSCQRTVSSDLKFYHRPQIPSNAENCSASIEVESHRLIQNHTQTESAFCPERKWKIKASLKLGFSLVVSKFIKTFGESYIQFSADENDGDQNSSMKGVELLLYRFRRCLRSFWEWMSQTTFMCPPVRKNKLSFHLDSTYFLHVVNWTAREKYPKLFSNENFASGTVSRSEIDDFKITHEVHKQSNLIDLTDLESILHSKLRCRLTSYQLRAVRFSLWREEYHEKQYPGECPDASLNTFLKLSKSNEHEDLYIDIMEGRIGLSLPKSKSFQVKGGILCDEMGLGKTVEVLGLIVVRPPSPDWLQYDSHTYLSSARTRYAAVREENKIVQSEKHRVDDDTIGCYCGSNDWNVDADWIECSVCNQWFHSSCAGSQCLDGNQMTAIMQTNRKAQSSIASEESANVSCFYRSLKAQQQKDHAFAPVEFAEDTTLSREKLLNGARGKDSFDFGLKTECMRKGDTAKLAMTALKHDRLESLTPFEERANDDEDAPFICPICFARAACVVPVAATLILVPGTIVAQWRLEIEKHVADRSLKAVEYTGVQIYSPNSRHKRVMATEVRDQVKDSVVVDHDLPFSHPLHFTTFDIVLCTYETLRAELNSVFREPRQFRARKTHRVCPTPLVGIKWWRIVLDEAQMVEGFSQAAQMVAHLHAEHRWCVTGTPIVRSPGVDLPGLLTVLAPVGLAIAQYKSKNLREFRNFVSCLDLELPKVPLDVVDLMCRHGYLTYQDVQTCFEDHELVDCVTVRERPCVTFSPNVGRKDAWEKLWEACMNQTGAQPSTCKSQKQDFCNACTEGRLLSLFQCWGRTGQVLVQSAKLLSSLIWRTKADDVIDELRLPQVSVTTITLQFTSLERYFYQRQIEKVLAAAEKHVKNVDIEMGQAYAMTSENCYDPTEGQELSTAPQLSQPKRSPISVGAPAPRTLDRMVLALRQACVHPQIGSKGLAAGASHRSASYGAKSYRKRRKKRSLLMTLENLPAEAELSDAARTSSSDNSEALSSADSDEGKNFPVEEGAAMSQQGSTEKQKIVIKKVVEEFLDHDEKEKNIASWGQVPKFLSTRDVLERLMKEARVEGEEQLRIICASLNGTAGLSWLADDIEAAVNDYRSVLQQRRQVDVTKGHNEEDSKKCLKAKGVIRVDDLQILHAMVNLKTLLEIRSGRGITNLGSSVVESDLKGEIETLQTKYLSKPVFRLSKTIASLQSIELNIDGLIEELKSYPQGMQWWSYFYRIPAQCNIVSKLKEALATHQNSRNFGFVTKNSRSARNSQRLEIRQNADFEMLVKLKLKGSKKKDEGQRDEQHQNTLIQCTEIDSTMFRDLSGVVLLLNDRTTTFQKLRDRLRAGVSVLTDSVQQLIKSDVNSLNDPVWIAFRNCRKCQGGNLLCWHCSLMSELEIYLGFFQFVRPIDMTGSLGTQVSISSLGVKGESDYMFTLNFLAAQLRKCVVASSLKSNTKDDGITTVSSLNQSNVSIIEILNLNSKYYDNLKKELEKVSFLFGVSYQSLLSMDELRMSQERFRFKTSEEIALDKTLKTKQLESLNVIHPLQLSYFRMTFESERTEAQQKLLKIEARLRFLWNLHLSQELQRTESATKTTKIALPSEDSRCPICLSEISEITTIGGLALLTCAHSFCIDCFRSLSSNRHSNVVCPICRTTSQFCDVLYAHPEADSAESFNLQSQPGLENIKVRGSWSVKVEAIVRRVLWIMKAKPSHEDAIDSHSSTFLKEKRLLCHDASDKLVIFTEWNEAMLFIASALSDNGIEPVIYRGTKVDRDNLTRFITSLDCRVLICNIKRASHGITLTVANHILFVEPCLMSADELQAIGRIRRIGQNKPQYIWKFVVKDSVEQKITERSAYLSSELMSSSSKLARQALTMSEIWSLLGMKGK